MSFLDNNSSNNFNPRQNPFQESGYQSGTTYSGSYNNILNNIRSFSTNVTNLTNSIYKMGSKSDSLQLRQSIEELMVKTMNSGKDIKAELERTSKTVPREKKAELHKLSSDFQTWLSKFQDVSKSYVNKRDTTPVPVAKQETFATQEYQDFPAPQNQGDNFQVRKQQLVEVENERDFNDQLIRERHQGIKDIETRVVELNEMFRDLAVMVDEQGVEIDNIESHLANAEEYTNQGVVEVQQAEKSQRSARNKLCCIAVIGVIVVAVIVLIALFASKVI